MDICDDGPALRREVGLFRARESRRVFDPVINVGTIAGPRESFVLRAQDAPAMDAALRADVVSRLLEDTGAGHDTAWLIRPGVPHPHDSDLLWLSAASLAFGMHGRALRGFYAVTRAGWLDVRTGQRRIWKRLRL